MKAAHRGLDSLGQFGSVGIVFQHVMIVDCFLDEIAFANPCIDGLSRRVGPEKEGLAIDLADDKASDLDLRIRPDHLQIEDEAIQPHRIDHSTQGVHDVLGLHASERP